jgi:serine/threonine-protein kinase
MTALVMELVEGPTLADRIAQGPIAVEEALPIVKQIADALEAAHEQGIVHRDLKPANVKLRPDGTVKVLDFGLAKALEPVAGGTDATGSPTITSPAMMTGVGVLLGTAAYMSPEQARGQAVDKRSDIWAFGCVLYEMLTGRRAFEGEDVADTLAGVLRGEPDWRALPSDIPTNIRTLLRRCFRKDRRQRLGDAGAARLEIEDVSGPSPPTEAGLVANRRQRALVAGLAVLIGAAVAGIAVWNLRPGGDPPEVSRVLLSVAPAEQLAVAAMSAVFGRPTRTAMAMSPDGRYVVFNATRDGKRELYLRPLDRLEATRIPGTEGSDSPFFSPDGQWVGFWQGDLRAEAIGELKKVPVSGGPAVTLCKTPPLYGASWGSTHTIVFAHAAGGLWRVSADGGAPQALTRLDTGKGEYSHRLPHLLPEGNDVIFTIQKALNRWDDAHVAVRSLVTGEQRVLIEGAADARYVRTGHLVYARMGTLMAVPFDVTRLEVAGGPRGIVDDVMQSVNSGSGIQDTGAAQFSVSESGSLVYVPGGIFPDRETSPVWVDRSGNTTPLPVTPRRG